MTYKKIFLDANILVDLFDTQRGSHAESKKIYKYLYANDIPAFTSCDIATTVYYLTTKATDNTQALEAMEAMEIINHTIKIIPFGNDELERTVTLMRAESIYKDFEDTLQYILALESGCDAVISNDKRFVSKDLPLYTSKAFVEKYL